MSYRVILQPRAVRDLQAAARCLFDRSRSSATARRWLSGIRRKIDTLKVSPERCPADPDSDAYGGEVRMLLYGKRPGTYRILFTIQGREVHILAIRHAARRNLTDEDV
jgi:plasmid stabilization system protein ParE